MSSNDVDEENLWRSLSTMFNEASKSMYLKKSYSLFIITKYVMIPIF